MRFLPTKTISLFLLVVFSLVTISPGVAAASSGSVGQACSFSNGSNFLSLPTWYEYLPGNTDVYGHCQPKLVKLSDIWLVIAAVIDILLRLGALIAVVMVIYGGVMFTTSNGNPETAAKARGVVINSLVGLLIAVMASFFVSFLAGSIS